MLLSMRPRLPSSMTVLEKRLGTLVTTVAGRMFNRESQCARTSEGEPIMANLKRNAARAIMLVFVGTLFSPLHAQTFTKDVAPIFQKSCVSCHREGTTAPMSLMTYKEVRPWARAIKERVLRRDMPPWHLDKTVGIRRYKNDISLNARDIATIVKWVDAGAPEGDAADMPKPPTFASEDNWFTGKPDLLVTTKDFVMYANGPD